MQRAGWSCAGLEPNDAAAGIARQRGVLVETAGLQDLVGARDDLDMITLWHVLEHLPDPGQAFDIINNLLRPGGKLVFCVPNLDSLAAAFLGASWSGYDTPRHVHTFSRQGLQGLAEKYGFRVLDRRCFFGGYDSMCYDLSFWLSDRQAAPWQRRLLIGIARSLAGRAISAPFLWMFDRMAWGSVVSYTLEKTGEVR